MLPRLQLQPFVVPLGWLAEPLDEIDRAEPLFLIEHPREIVRPLLLQIPEMALARLAHLLGDDDPAGNSIPGVLGAEQIRMLRTHPPSPPPWPCARRQASACVPPAVSAAARRSSGSSLPTCFPGTSPEGHF